VIGTPRLAQEIEWRHRAAQFLALEAMLLDAGKLEEWFELLDEDLIYEVPLLEARDNREQERSAGGFRFRDTKPMIRVRIDRLGTASAHAEYPPSRTVRSVATICVLPTSTPEVVSVSSTLIVYRHRGIDAYGDLIHARRNDQLRIVGDGARLVARSIVLAENSLSTPNLAIFL
jgi:3-phenylpropionate/cinnamic acid dioxygenase small subunit